MSEADYKFYAIQGIVKVCQGHIDATGKLPAGVGIASNLYLLYPGELENMRANGENVELETLLSMVTVLEDTTLPDSTTRPYTEKELEVRMFTQSFTTNNPLE